MTAAASTPARPRRGRFHWGWHLEPRAMRFAGYRRTRARWRFAFGIGLVFVVVWMGAALTSLRLLGGAVWVSAAMLAFFGTLGWREYFDRRLARIAWLRHPSLRGRAARLEDVEVIARTQSRRVMVSTFFDIALLLTQIPLAWIAWGLSRPVAMVALLGAGGLLTWSMLAQLVDRRRALRWATWAPRKLTRNVFR